MYCLENKKEASRLEEQNAHDIYSIRNELMHVDFSHTKSILDAGCGSGYVSRSILDLFPQMNITGIDFGPDRLAEAKLLSESEGKSIQFQEGDLNNINIKDNTFDMVISRFVFHHLDRHQTVMDELARVVKPGGQVVIIDSDGVFFNLYSNDSRLLDLLTNLEKKFHLDFFAARKLKSWMANSGLKNVRSSIAPMHFQKESLLFERDQYEQRFSFMMEKLEELMGKQEAHELRERYLDALDDFDGSKGTELFYNRFIATGFKLP